MRGEYFQYIVSNIVCVLIFGIMLVHDLVSIDRQEKQFKFDRALVPFMIYFICDAFWAAIMGNMIPRNLISTSIVDFAIAISLGLITYLWLRFVMAVENVPSREKPLFRFITLIPFLIGVIGLVVTYFVARPLIYDENLTLQPLYHIFMNGPSYFYIVAILIYTLRRASNEKNHVEKRKHLITGLLPLMVVIGGIVQMLMPETAIFCFASTFLMLIFYIQSMQGQISIDPLTGLNNRGQLAKYLSQESLLRKEHKMSFVIMIDVNDFKEINDTYGHSQGDRALVILSEALRKIVAGSKTPIFLGRYGGDEFIMVVHPQDELEVVTIVDSIRQEVEANCKSEGTPYVLSLGVGYDKLGDENDDFHACMERADRKLYLNKEQVKQQRLANQSTQNNHKPRA